MTPEVGLRDASCCDITSLPRLAVLIMLHPLRRRAVLKPLYFYVYSYYSAHFRYTNQNLRNLRSRVENKCDVTDGTVSIVV
jgi:hypothetical protein